MTQIKKKNLFYIYIIYVLFLFTYNMKIVYKPVSVLCSNLSRINITINLKQPTQTKIGVIQSLFGLAPGGVYLAIYVTINAVRSYRTFSPLLTTSGIFSVALSLKSPLPGVTRYRYSWRPDFPLYKIIAKQLLDYLHHLAFNFT